MISIFAINVFISAFAARIAASAVITKLKG